MVFLTSGVFLRPKFITVVDVHKHKWVRCAHHACGESLDASKAACTRSAVALTAVEECLRELESLRDLKRGTKLCWRHIQARTQLLLYPGKAGTLGAAHAENIERQDAGTSVRDARPDRPDCLHFAPKIRSMQHRRR